MCPCAFTLLSQQSTLAPNSFLTRFSIVPQQTGFSRVLPPNKFPHTLWGWGCGGLVYLHILFSIRVNEPGLVPASGWGHVCLAVCVPERPLFRGVFPAFCACTRFLMLKLSLFSTHILVNIHLSFHLSLTYVLFALLSYADTAFFCISPPLIFPHFPANNQRLASYFQKVTSVDLVR